MNFKFLLPLLLSAPLLSAQTPDADWQRVLALDSAPRKTPTSRSEARSIGLQMIAEKEAALKSFIAQHPKDPRAAQAVVRLAHLTLSKADFNDQPQLRKEAEALLDRALATAKDQRTIAEYSFGKITLTMRQLQNPSPTERDQVMTAVTTFQSRFPWDPRVPQLLTEIAGLYDDQPRKKSALLTEALRGASTPELKSRIGDDLKRLSLLGQTITIKGPSATGGGEIDTAQYRGKVVVIYFFASWSPPSVGGLKEVEYLRSTFPASQVEIVGVSLDPSLEALRSVTGGAKFSIIWDGKGWASPIVRGVSINAIPTLWVLDKKGVLKTLNANTDSEGLIRSLLR